MLNQVVLVGRLKYISLDFIELAVYSKNDPNEYDIIPVVLSEKLYDNVCKYCKLNDITAVKGRLSTKDGKLIIIAEKFTFLSSSSEGGD